MGGEDHTARAADQTGTERRRVTVAEAAEYLGITAEAVRTRIKRGKLDSVKEPPDRTGTVYVLLRADQTRPNADPTSQGQDQTSDQTRRDELVSNLREQVSYLQGVIATRDRELALRAEEIRRRDSALEREQQLTAFFAERLRELEAPAHDAPQDVEESPTEGTDEQQGRGPIPDHNTPSEAPESPQMHTVGGVPRDGDTDSPDHHTPSERERPWWRRLFEG